MTSSRKSVCVRASRLILRTFSRVYTLMQQLATSSITLSSRFHRTVTHWLKLAFDGSV